MARARLFHVIYLVTFVDVALRVITVAWVALGILVLALLAAAIERFLVASERADDIVFETLAGLDRSSALRVYGLFKSRTKNIGVAFLLAVVFGPLGAYAYLGVWGRAALALVTLNGLGAWWVESWFSIPQIVLIEKRAISERSRADLPFVLADDARFAERMAG